MLMSISSCFVCRGGGRVRITCCGRIYRGQHLFLKQEAPPLPFTGGNLGQSRFPEMQKVRMVLIGPPKFAILTSFSHIGHEIILSDGADGGVDLLSNN